MLRNKEEDSELRIKAYLALVDCPSAEVAKAIKELIDNELSNQGKVLEKQQLLNNYNSRIM